MTLWEQTALQNHSHVITVATHNINALIIVEEAETLPLVKFGSWVLNNNDVTSLAQQTKNNKCMVVFG